MHKRVCGERSNPFCWPGFSTAEIQGMVALSTESVAESPDGELSSWLAKFGEEYELPNKFHRRENAFLVISTAFYYPTLRRR